jgi:hypothetical protein
MLPPHHTWINLFSYSRVPPASTGSPPRLFRRPYHADRCLSACFAAARPVPGAGAPITASASATGGFLLAGPRLDVYWSPWTLAREYAGFLLPIAAYHGCRAHLLCLLCARLVNRDGKCECLAVILEIIMAVTQSIADDIEINPYRRINEDRSRVRDFCFVFLDRHLTSPVLKSRADRTFVFMYSMFFSPPLRAALPFSKICFRCCRA